MKFSNIFLIIFSFFLLFSGCKENDLFIDTSLNHKENFPVSFNISIAPPDGTRSMDNESIKTEFEEGEVIHIMAIFDCVSNNKEYQHKEYVVFKHEGNNKWSPLDEENILYWPMDAISGSFSAFYLNGSTGVFTERDMDPILLSSFTYSTDPLEANANKVEYGHTIFLAFKHIFAHLTLTEFAPGVADYFWFSRNDDSGESELNNAFYFKYNPENKEIQKVFTQVPDDNNNNLIYISRPAEIQPTDDGVYGQISFFLEPGKYDWFQLMYQRTNSLVGTYLTYKNSFSDRVEGGNVEILEGNGRYEFSVLRSIGVVIEQDPSDDWDDSPPTVIVDVEAFLRAANSGADYWEQDPNTQKWVQILRGNLNTRGVDLLVNADFRFFKYYAFAAGEKYNKDFLPTINLEFNGNYHYIYNLSCPLFYSNSGRIVNLGISNVDSGDEALISNRRYLTPYNTQENFSNTGIIARENTSTGTIENVRISNVKITVDILTSSTENPSQRSHQVGIVVGKNDGIISDIKLGDNLSLSIENYEGETVVPKVYIGGIAGDNSNYIKNIRPDDDSNSPNMIINTSLDGEEGLLHCGGIVGNTAGDIINVFLPQITINCDKNKLIQQYIGGAVGKITSSTTKAVILDRCIVNGKIKAGKVFPYLSEAMPYCFSYVGGLSGSINLESSITNSTVSMSINVEKDENEKNYLSNEFPFYGTGGAFGIIEKTSSDRIGTMRTIAINGSSLSGGILTGCFAGISQKGFSWEDFYSLSKNEITVRKFPAYPYISLLAE